MARKPAYESSYSKGGVSRSLESVRLVKTLYLRISVFVGQSAHRKSRIRYSRKA